MLISYTVETGSRKHSNIGVEPLDPADRINDADGAIALNGAATINVEQHLQEALAVRGGRRDGDPASVANRRWLLRRTVKNCALRLMRTSCDARARPNRAADAELPAIVAFCRDGTRGKPHV